MAQQGELDAAGLVQVVGELIRWEEELSGMGIPPAAAGSVGAAREQAVSPSQDTAPSRSRVQEESRPSAAPRVAAKGDVETQLKVLAEGARECTACRLHEGRTQSVFSRGASTATVAFVGEGPGYHEDQQGSPFVGRAGQLLDKMIQAMGLKEGDFYICNVVKCRPPENRTPQADEALACKKWLTGQLDLVRPQVIVALGKCATEHLGLLDPESRKWRGQWGTWNGIDVMATYHPAFLLRSPQFKRATWNDLQEVMKRLPSGDEGIS